ncbi:integrase/recombinase xerD homolog [Saccostrea echinata]|uniref:integrase/recombinase xerD homolog n=1 Tax=Saccostrea echinata TaxID=191078 RepID=UPI002A7F7CF9|nr:integrase/recombinase xerD homolog [Saccostrea echinata]
MPPKQRSKKGELAADEQSSSSSTGRKRKRVTPTQQTETVMQSALPTIDYTLLAKHILTEQQKLTSSEGNGLAEATASQHGEASPSVIQNKEPQSSSELVNPAATTSVTNGTPQASAMVPASALGALLDNVFTESTAGSTILRTTGNCHSGTPITDLTSSTRSVLVAALSPPARYAYRHSWQLFLNYRKDPVSLPLPITDICNFIGFLFEKQYSSSSTASHISALGYVHKIINLPDPTQTFIVRKLLKGCHKLLPTQDARLPITKNIMHKILAALVFTVPQALNQVLLQALFLLCFNAFLRLGEVISKTLADKDKVLQIQDIIFSGEKCSPSAVQIVLRHHKSQQKNEPIIISIQANPSSQFCPVHNLYKYKSLFPHVSGPFFQFVNGTPVTYSYVSSELSKAIAFAGLDPKRYKGHSFRIGAATHAAQLGYSETFIQHLGRWNSNVLHRYIRIKSFQL